MLAYTENRGETAEKFSIIVCRVFESVRLLFILIIYLYSFFYFKYFY